MMRFCVTASVMILALLVTGSAQLPVNTTQDRTPRPSRAGSAEGQSGGDPSNLRTEVGRTKTADGVRLTLD